MHMARSPFRLRNLILAFGLIALFAFVLSRDKSGNGSIIPSKPSEQETHKIGGYDRQAHIRFWEEFLPLLNEYEPDSEPPARLGTSGAIGFDAKKPASRPELIDLAGDGIEIMQSKHKGFIAAIKSLNLKPHYTPGTRGLVSTAGGSYLPVLVISLRMLRRTGSELPMEVFLADPEEYEEFICETVLPELNARCVILSNILDASTQDVTIEKYQFKPFAMLFSSFEEILFLDADAFPLRKPEEVFQKEPFLSANLVLWPDFWASTASPLFYEITSQDIPPMNLRQSTESGEIFMSKKTHAKSLLLATYYNYWGPTHYWPLLSQGAPGEGDKETFIAAATSLKEPFYQVSEPICAIGHGTKGGMAGSAMVQFDPSEDYALTSKGEFRVNGSTAPGLRPFFVHANFPKFNPATVFSKQYVNPAFEDDGVTYTRAWTIPEHVITDLGDTEKYFWREIMWTGCELESKFESWKSETGICQGVKKYWNAMFAAPGDEVV